MNLWPSISILLLAIPMPKYGQENKKFKKTRNFLFSTVTKKLSKNLIIKTRNFIKSGTINLYIIYLAICRYTPLFHSGQEFFSAPLVTLTHSLKLDANS